MSFHFPFTDNDPSTHTSLQETAHRPWPMPTTPWVWRQSWLDLLFLHWPVPVSAIRHLVPPELEIEEFDGSSWVALVPFHMRGVMLRFLPDLPGISAFPELNVRLYVSYKGKRGVWFLSLDADNTLAVWAARTFFHLPYFNAEMQIQEAQAHNTQTHDTQAYDSYTYQSIRQVGSYDCQEPAVLKMRYGPSSPVYHAQAGTLEHFLTERYCLYTKNKEGQLLCGEIHHIPWPLQKAEIEIEENSVLASWRLPITGELSRKPPLMHFSKGVDVVVWGVEPVKD